MKGIRREHVRTSVCTYLDWDATTNAGNNNKDDYFDYPWLRNVYDGNGKCQPETRQPLHLQMKRRYMLVLVSRSSGLSELSHEGFVAHRTFIYSFTLSLIRLFLPDTFCLGLASEI